jgi:preprotein translocase subunit SecA
MLKNPFKKNRLNSKYRKLISQINLLENNLKILNNSELRSRILQLKTRYQQSHDLQPLLADSFALTREVSFRTIGLRHFDVQLIGGVVLNNQKIAEMKTGEGKTLVATLPACLNALTGKGVHIVTVNDYLANRDQILMGQIYRSLGFDTGLIQDRLSRAERRENYAADITYVTNYELTFDFLRDNMASKLDDISLRPFNYCIVDEVDSVLIDEAQTPLIVSNNVQTQFEKYFIAAEIIEYLEPKIHYTVDEKNRNIILTDKGSKQIEEILFIKDLYDPQDPWIPYIINAIKAKALFFLNTHYIIKKNRIVIVDEFTGRIMPDRRWGDGLHQAIEAKEKVQIRQKTETVASITYQNFFLLYPKLSGMTGTGKTAEIEFEQIYNLSVDEIPTAQITNRKDLSDFIYKDQFSKWNAIAKACFKIASTGQPVLIGTTTIEKSEMLAELLAEYKLSYQLLNAKPENIRKESEVVGQAGKKRTITIATNLAGRGTDIILGGNINFEIQKELYNILTLSKNFTRSNNETKWQPWFKKLVKYNSQKSLSVLLGLLCDQKFLTFSEVGILRILREDETLCFVRFPHQSSVRFLITGLKQVYKKHQGQENKIVKNLGGLYIIGTERNDSRRIDNQLRGRCGRQGDPGTSRFFLSLDDNLLRLFGGPKIQSFLQNQMVDDSPLESNLLTKSLDSAQKQVEERSYQQRKNLFDYDDVLNKQRTIIYYERRQVLNTLSSELSILSYGEQVIVDLLYLEKISNSLTIEIIPLLENVLSTNLVLKYFQNSTLVGRSLNNSELKLYLFDEFWLTYETSNIELEIYGDNLVENLEKRIFLVNIDRVWREHLQKINFLREAVGWRGYGQRNPLYEYKKDAFLTFEECEKTLRQLVLYDRLKSTVL